MLAHLSIRNILLLKSCEIDFTAGLNVLTGETGAGKSILLDALGLVLGERSDASLVRSGETSASVTAEFFMPPKHAARALLAELELEADDLLILRRSLAADGKSRAFVNDAPVSVAALKRLGEALVERHGQHDQRGLLDAKTHRTALDAYAGNAALLKKTASTFAAWKQARQAYDDLQSRMRGSAGEEEWLRHSVAELEKLDAQEGEEERLVEARARANQVRQSIASLEQALQQIHAHGGLALALRQATRSLQKAPGDGETLTPIIAGLERAETELEEATIALEKLVQAAELDPAEFERAEDRLHALRAAARKYHVSVEGLPGLLVESQAKLKRLINFDAEQAAAQKTMDDARTLYDAADAVLAQARSKAAQGFGKAIVKELSGLKMANTQLRVNISELPEQSWGEAGKSQVMFEVATNAGQAFGPLSRVASGGELSRLLLALKVVLRGDSAVTAIFDEIDTGTGGAVAEAIGQRLKKLAEATQVLVVTHLPQVAAHASHHLFIAKAGSRQVETNVVPLSGQERTEELARMISGATISQEARQAASKLLEAAS